MATMMAHRLGQDLTQTHSDLRTVTRDRRSLFQSRVSDAMKSETELEGADDEQDTSGEVATLLGELFQRVKDIG